MIFIIFRHGNYKIEIELSDTNIQEPMFLVKANPNGNNFRDQGSAVIGCYNPKWTYNNKKLFW